MGYRFFKTLVCSLCTGILLLSAVNAHADSRLFVAVLPFQQEKASLDNEWLGYSLSSSLSSGLGYNPGIFPVRWTRLVDLLDEKDRVHSDNAWSESELRAIAKTCGMDCIIAGRYSVAADRIDVTFRVCCKLSTRDAKLQFSLADAYQQRYNMALKVAELLHVTFDGRDLKDIQKPIVSGSRSFELMGRALRAYSLSRDEELKKWADEWAKVEPQSPQRDYHLALLRWAKKPTVSAALLEQSIKKYPGSANSWNLLGIAREQLGNYKGAREAYHCSIDLSRNGDQFVYMRLATCEDKLGRDMVASKLRTKAELLAERWIERVWLGDYYYTTGQYTYASACYKKALAMGASPAYTGCCLGYCYYKLNQFREAEKAYQISLRANPNHAYTLGSLGRLRVKQELYKEAVPYLRRAVIADPKDVRFRYELAHALLWDGDQDGSAKELEALLKINPKEKRAHRILANYYRRRGMVFNALYHDLCGAEGGKSNSTLIGLLAGMFVIGASVVALFIRRKLRDTDGSGKNNNNSFEQVNKE